MAMKKIMLIEDDSDDQVFFNLVLSEIAPGADCKIVSNGVEGVDAIVEGVKPEIIFLDLNMPVMNGYEFLEKYHELKCDAPVVVITTSSDKNDIEKSAALGAKGFITKPTDFNRFKNSLRQVFEFDFSFVKSSLQVF